MTQTHCSEPVGCSLPRLSRCSVSIHLGKHAVCNAYPAYSRKKNCRPKI